MIDTFALGVQGLQSGMQRLDGAAHRALAVTGKPGSGVDAVDVLVEQKQASTQVQAAIGVIKVADEALGALLDVFA